MRWARDRAFLLAIIVLSLGQPCQNLSAQVQPARSELRTPLEIVHPIETSADLQRELNQLEARSTNVDDLLAENAKSIYGATSQALNSTAEAVLGPIFGRSAEYESIQKNVTQAATAARGFKDALAQAEAAREAGQTSLALEKTAAAADFAREAQTKSQEAYEQTAAIFKRTSGVLTGEMSPAQLRQLAQRYWESRRDLSTAANGLLAYVKADDEQRLLIALKNELNAEISELTDLKAKQAFIQKAPRSETHLPVGQPRSNGPPRVILTPPDTDTTAGGVAPQGTEPNAPITATPQPEPTADAANQPPLTTPPSPPTTDTTNQPPVTMPTPTTNAANPPRNTTQLPPTTDAINQPPVSDPLSVSPPPTTPSGDTAEAGDILARALNNIPEDNATRIPEIPSSQCDGIRFCNSSAPQSSQQATDGSPRAPTQDLNDRAAVIRQVEQARQRDTALKSEQQQLNQQIADHAAKLEAARQQTTALRPDPVNAGLQSEQSSAGCNAAWSQWSSCSLISDRNYFKEMDAKLACLREANAALRACTDTAPTLSNQLKLK